MFTLIEFTSMLQAPMLFVRGSLLAKHRGANGTKPECWHGAERRRRFYVVPWCSRAEGTLSNMSVIFHPANCFRVEKKNRGRLIGSLYIGYRKYFVKERLLHPYIGVSPPQLWNGVKRFAVERFVIQFYDNCTRNELLRLWRVCSSLFYFCRWLFPAINIWYLIAGDFVEKFGVRNRGWISFARGQGDSRGFRLSGRKT